MTDCNNLNDQCKHGVRHERNCYECFLEHFYKEKRAEKTKTQLDLMQETISELKIRIAKLEIYKRLQDDLNASHLGFMNIVMKNVLQQFALSEKSNSEQCWRDSLNEEINCLTKKLNKEYFNSGK